jgi:hypothetical protein
MFESSPDFFSRLNFYECVSAGDITLRSVLTRLITSELATLRMALIAT